MRGTRVKLLKKELTKILGRSPWNWEFRRYKKDYVNNK